MGVDLKAAATHSYMSKSHRNRGRLKVVRACENNSRMSTSGNVFNRLGRGVDMRETLNRRTE